MFVVFDLDGTLADGAHRQPLVSDGKKDWRAYFAACPGDKPIAPVVAVMHRHMAAGDRVEIWSARSAEVEAETRAWLIEHGIGAHLLKHMRAVGDHTNDAKLKLSWLAATDPKPDVFYDDRQRVVDAYRSAGMTVFQVAPSPWDLSPDERLRNKVLEPGPQGATLTLMIGPSGAGKSTLTESYPASWVVSTDEIRENLCDSFRSTERGDDVFLAVRRIADARLKSGLSCVIDATHLQRKTRLAHVALAPPGVNVRYVVVDRPLADKVRDGGWRNSVEVKGVPLIQHHHERFQAQLDTVLAGDRLPNVTVQDTRSEAARVNTKKANGDAS
jgi:predicted kinase